MSTQLYTYHFEETPASLFDFESAATAHGWVALRPFAWDETSRELRRIHRLGSGQVVHLRLQDGSREPQAAVPITAESANPFSVAEEIEVHQAVRRMLRLDEDFSDFYQLQAQFDDWQLQLRPGEGRLLRCPSLFEDIVYTLCTTNINWSGTIRMVDRLVSRLGQVFPGQSEWRSFPAADAIAAAGPDFLKQEIGLGYRSSYVYELAVNVIEGRLNLEDFEDPEQPTAALHRELLRLKGVGDYAAATILMLLGRYDRLAIDSELRAFVSKKYFQGEAPSDAQIRELYAPWGQWQYLAYWFDSPV